jgi:hypothetical protein
MPLSIADNQPVAAPDVLAAPLPGDYDNDGEVTMADYDVWKSNYGSLTHLAADGNGNRIVDAADYTVWRNLLNGPASGTGAMTTDVVPEPGGGTLMLVGLMHWILLRRARRNAPRRSIRRRGRCPANET